MLDYIEAKWSTGKIGYITVDHLRSNDLHLNPSFEFFTIVSLLLLRANCHMPFSYFRSSQDWSSFWFFDNCSFPFKPFKECKELGLKVSGKTRKHRLKWKLMNTQSAIWGREEGGQGYLPHSLPIILQIESALFDPGFIITRFLCFIIAISVKNTSVTKNVNNANNIRLESYYHLRFGMS